MGSMKNRHVQMVEFVGKISWSNLAIRYGGGVVPHILLEISLNFIYLIVWRFHNEGYCNIAVPIANVFAIYNYMLNIF